MNKKTVAGLEVSVVPEFPFEHGFLGVNLKRSDAELEKFSREAGFKKLALVKQTHSDLIVEVTSSHLAPSNSEIVHLGEGDAILAEREISRAIQGKLALGIITADCVPLLLANEHYIAVVHAGWRGLANGIIQKTLQRISAAGSKEISVAIGPCAGDRQYEVEIDVISQLPNEAIYEQVSDKKFLLSLADTSAALISSWCLSQSISSSIYSTNICTISNPAFNSYRRDKDKAGRNLSFIVC